MTQVTSENIFHIGDITYQIGEQIERTPEAILALESMQQLILARRITPDGKPVTRKITPEAFQIPVPPSDERLQENPQLGEEYAATYGEYLRILRQQTEVPVPPNLGYVYTRIDIPAYFYLRQLDTDVVSVLPYDEADQPAHRLFRVNIAEIAE